MKIYRQGDVMIVSGKIPDGAQPVKPTARGYVLAEGEVTGHAHVIEATPLVEAKSMAGQLFLRVGGDVQVRHEEHAWITLPAGEYQVIKQVEYTPRELVRVRD